MADPLADVIQTALLDMELQSVITNPEVANVADAIRTHIAAVLDGEAARWRSPASLPAHHAIEHLRTSLLGKATEEQP